MKIPHFLNRLGGRKTRIDDAHRLIRVSRDGYKYCHRPRCLLLQIDILKGRPDRLIYESTIRQWMPPHESEPITDLQRKEIVELIRGFLEEQGHSVEIQ